MNNESKKLTWAVGLVAGLGVLSIAYAALSSTLNIQGKDATINTGYIHFDTCEATGIGSTNPDYIDGTDSKKSGGLFERSDGATGVIPSAQFSTNWAKALADPGVVNVEATKKQKDTVTIKDAKLNDFGSFIVYELNIYNESTSPMRLRKLPNIEVSLDSDSVTSAGAGAVSESNIERTLYDVYDENNFSNPFEVDGNTKPLQVLNVDTNGAIVNAERTDGNYVVAGGRITWYLRIGFKNYDSNTNHAYGTTKFNFSVTPEWEAVMS